MPKIEAGVVLRMPVARPIGGDDVGLFMPDGTRVPGVTRATMRYEPGKLPVCVVELIGVRVEHNGEA